MSKMVKFNDVLTLEQKAKVAELKQEMHEAPNKKEVDGIAAEIYLIYEESRQRSLGEEKKC